VVLTAHLGEMAVGWVTANHTIDQTQFASVDWKLAYNGADVVVS